MSPALSGQPMQRQFFTVTCTVELWVDIDPSWDEEDILAEVRCDACISAEYEWTCARVHRSKEKFKWPTYVWYIRQFLRRHPKLAREIATYVQ